MDEETQKALDRLKVLDQEPVLKHISYTKSGYLVYNYDTHDLTEPTMVEPYVHVEQLNLLFVLMKQRFPDGWSFDQLYELVEKGEV